MYLQEGTVNFVWVWRRKLQPGHVEAEESGSWGEGFFEEI